MSHTEAIADYLEGPARLRHAVANMTEAELDARPIPGAMTTREVVCHIADFDAVYAERMKRALAEDKPPLPGGNPEQFRAALAYGRRDVEEELTLIESVRGQMSRILRAIPEAGWSRTGVHTEDGPLSVEQLFQRITNHIPHHIAFIEEKRKALGQSKD